MGYSQGGLICTRVAQENPASVASLILINPALAIKTKLSPKREALLESWFSKMPTMGFESGEVIDLSLQSQAAFTYQHTDPA